MERVTFLIEETGERVSCMLNPERVVLRRSSGLVRRRSLGGELEGTTDDLVLRTGGGSTEIELDLLFDLSVGGRADGVLPVADVREMTRALWQLSERSDSGFRAATARLIWGRSWNMRVVVDALAERLEEFTPVGAPQRSWLRVRLLRVDEEPARSLEDVQESLAAVEGEAALGTSLDDAAALSDLELEGNAGDDVLGAEAMQERAALDSGLWDLSELVVEMAERADPASEGSDTTSADETENAAEDDGATDDAAPDVDEAALAAGAEVDDFVDGASDAEAGGEALAEGESGASDLEGAEPGSRALAGDDSGASDLEGAEPGSDGGAESWSGTAAPGAPSAGPEDGADPDAGLMADAPDESETGEHAAVGPEPSGPFEAPPPRRQPRARRPPAGAMRADAEAGPEPPDADEDTGPDSPRADARRADTPAGAVARRAARADAPRAGTSARTDAPDADDDTSADPPRADTSAGAVAPRATRADTAARADTEERADPPDDDTSADAPRADAPAGAVAPRAPRADSPQADTEERADATGADDTRADAPRADTPASAVAPRANAAAAGTPTSTPPGAEGTDTPSLPPTAPSAAEIRASSATQLQPPSAAQLRASSATQLRATSAADLQPPSAAEIRARSAAEVRAPSVVSGGIVDALRFASPTTVAACLFVVLGQAYRDTGADGPRSPAPRAPALMGSPPRVRPRSEPRAPQTGPAVVARPITLPRAVAQRPPTPAARQVLGSEREIWERLHRYGEVLERLAVDAVESSRTALERALRAARRAVALDLSPLEARVRALSNVDDILRDDAGGQLEGVHREALRLWASGEREPARRILDCLELLDRCERQIQSALRALEDEPALVVWRDACHSLSASDPALPASASPGVRSLPPALETRPRVAIYKLLRQSSELPHALRAPLRHVLDAPLATASWQHARRAAFELVQREYERRLRERQRSLFDSRSLDAARLRTRRLDLIAQRRFGNAAEWRRLSQADPDVERSA